LLTAEGSAFQLTVSDLLAQFAMAVNRLRRQSHHNLVGLTLLPSLAARWLAPRLADFMNAHPDIELSVTASREVQHLAHSGLDIAIRFGAGSWHAHTAEQLMGDWLIPVCRPGFLPSVPVSPSALLNQPLLHPVGTEDWQDWFAAQSIGHGELRGLRFDDAGTLIQAALDGSGIALTRTSLIARSIAAGELVIACCAALPTHQAYWLVRPEKQVTTPAIATVCNWLRQLARDTTVLVENEILRGNISRGEIVKPLQSSRL